MFLQLIKSYRTTWEKSLKPESDLRNTEEWQRNLFALKEKNKKWSARSAEWGPGVRGRWGGFSEHWPDIFLVSRWILTGLLRDLTGMWTLCYLLHTGLQQENDTGLNSFRIKAKTTVSESSAPEWTSRLLTATSSFSFVFLFLARSHFVRAAVTLSKWWLFQSDFSEDKSVTPLWMWRHCAAMGVDMEPLHLLSNTRLLPRGWNKTHSFKSFCLLVSVSHQGPVEIKVKKQKAYQWNEKLTQSVCQGHKQADNCWVWCWRRKFWSEEEKQEVVWWCSFLRSWWF